MKKELMKNLLGDIDLKEILKKIIKELTIKVSWLKNRPENIDCLGSVDIPFLHGFIYFRIFFKGILIYEFYLAV